MPSSSVVIVDYGVGNLQSVLSKLQMLGHSNARISSDASEIIDASRLVLPGVGHFSEGMAQLRSRHLIAPLEEAVLRRGTPILGICLGMQLFFSSSAEGGETGLNWIPGKVRKFDAPGLRVPHMGWNRIHKKAEHPWLGSVSDGERYYFCHSYYVTADNADVVLATCLYGDEFHAIVRQNNVFGVQFHPEKSHRHGLDLIDRFVRMTSNA